jgi:signal transduction histidine kinase
VDVRVCTNGGMSILEVADTGIGVSVPDRERLFERLYRAPEAVDHHIQGAGLGLSIVKAIVTAHEGWVDVESAPGQGSTFRVVLPARQAQKSRLSASSMPRSAS